MRVHFFQHVREKRSPYALRLLSSCRTGKRRKKNAITFFPRPFFRTMHIVYSLSVQTTSILNLHSLENYTATFGDEKERKTVQLYHRCLAAVSQRRE